MAANAVEVEDLRKSYGPVHALQGVTFSVAEGEVFALLGPNGAGKTTTVEILEGFRRRDGGRATVLGFDPASGSRALKQQMGIVLQTSGVDPYLTVSETVDMFRGYYPKPRSRDEVLQLVGLEDKRDARVTRLSGGQKRRLDVAIALAGDPRVLFLDEPTTGFDPGAKRNAWEVIKGLAGLGKTIFLTSHSMDEVQYLADRVVIIAAGKIVAQGTPETLVSAGPATTTIRFRAPQTPLPESFVKAAHVDGDMVEIETEDATRALYDLTSWALQSGISLDGLQVTRPSLEDVYLEITGEVQEADAKT
ncbi:MAG TPA: ABC transporter ATP-binding protein [Candidatus Limnocylindrales bacterium]|nr:ABC transporter ATP-binding protein [Candidatus Limnocylindrales bacterium]